MGGIMGENTVGRPMEILLVEDSLTSARLTMGSLKNGDVQHRLTWLRDGIDALEFLHQAGKYKQAPHPDLILLDLGLPGKNGCEVLAEIKSDEQLKMIPVVVLTASTDEEDISETKRLDVENYLTKPVDIAQFLRVVNELSQYWHADMILPTI
ncbi:Two-component transcriptional response regulator, LuxR family [hydrothermal vent metagenome]|uniref:Two-component transcriptional response regulator, LuxR family n=1 Tax=hydrothermal vent metagenome TaxID=652676 RepID=A0A3B1DQ20_9ZZZZ